MADGASGETDRGGWVKCAGVGVGWASKWLSPRGRSGNCNPQCMCATATASKQSVCGLSAAEADLPALRPQIDSLLAVAVARMH